MIKISVFLLFICLSLMAHCQQRQGITFEVENLSKPEQPVFMWLSDDVFEELILLGDKKFNNKYAKRYRYVIAKDGTIQAVKNDSVYNCRKNCFRNYYYGSDEIVF
jgi:hypothetical protein